MSRCKSACDTLSVYGLVTAVGVGFVAYSATHLYVCFCAPQGFWGFVQSLILMDSTFCQMILGLVHHTQSLYGAVMISFLFSIVGGIGKGVAWMTGGTPGEVPTTIQSRVLTRK